MGDNINAILKNLLQCPAIAKIPLNEFHLTGLLTEMLWAPIKRHDLTSR
jgi:hypothetical protein